MLRAAEDVPRCTDCAQPFALPRTAREIQTHYREVHGRDLTDAEAHRKATERMPAPRARGVPEESLGFDPHVVSGGLPSLPRRPTRGGG